MAFTGLFDACIFYPAPLRDLMMHLALTDLFRARWTDRIHDEWCAALVRSRPELADKLQRTRRLMNEAVEDCLIVGYEHLIDNLTLPDPNDRHVLAAAIVGRADVIVTKNLRDFPKDYLQTYDIDVQHPDEFVRHVLDLDEALALDAIRSHRANLTKPPYDVAGYLDVLARQELPETVAFLRSRDRLL
jgi:predicted nucleic acid-binding protein